MSETNDLQSAIDELQTRYTQMEETRFPGGTGEENPGTTGSDIEEAKEIARKLKVLREALEIMRTRE